MTQPRRIRPAATYLVTRRTLRRHHLMCPDGQVEKPFLYALAVAACEYRVQVHAVVLMSTHEHLVVTDTDGRLPDFLRDLHRHVALAVKRIRKWEGPVWDQEPTSTVELLTPQAILEKLAYCMANPVEAGLVRYARDWPGVGVRPRDLGRRTWRIARPNVFFSPRNPKWPEHVELALTLPPMLLEAYAACDVRRLVAEELQRREQAARTQVSQTGRSFVGADRCRKRSPYARTTRPEPARERNPTFAVGRGQREAFFEAAEALRSFREAYRAARERWRKGERAVPFPPGTWAMVRLHGARYADPPGLAA
ncbi:MAG: transposase [Myxococcota bacterium]